MAHVRVLAREINHPILHPLALKSDEGLTPDGAAVLAVVLNPALRAARDQRALAQAQLLDAGLLPDPELTYSLDAPAGGDSAGKVTAFGLGVDWNVTSLLSRSAGVRKAAAHGEAVALEIAWQEWQVAQEAKATVYRLAGLQERIALLGEVRRRVAENLAHVRKAVLDGFMAADDLHAVRAARSKVNGRLLTLQQQADRQRLHLLRLMGLPADSPIHLNTDLRLPSRVVLAEASLLDGLEERRLDLLALRRGYDSQEAAVRRAVLEQFPRIRIGPAIGRDTDNLTTMGFGLNIELPVFNRGQGRIAAEQATRKKLYDEYISRVFAARSDIAQLQSTIHFLNEQIAAAQTTAAALGKLAENYHRALLSGRADALAYYTVWDELTAARTELVDLEGQLAEAVVALELATGYYEIPGSVRWSAAAPPAPNAETTE